MHLRSDLSPPVIFLLATFLSTTSAILQDGLMVPFGSGLPPCASLCGTLSDVQGGCVPPVKPTVDQSCFCTDARITPFAQGPAGVAQVCAAAQCSQPDLQVIQSWFAKFCGTSGQSNNDASKPTEAAGDNTTPTNAAAGAANGNSDSNNSWSHRYLKTVLIFILPALILTAIAIPACIWRRRYLQKQQTQKKLYVGTDALKPTEMTTVGGNAMPASGSPWTPGKKSPNVQTTQIA